MVFAMAIVQVPATSVDVVVLVTYTCTFLSPLSGSVKLERYTLAFPAITELPLLDKEVACVPSGAVTVTVTVLVSLA